MTLSFQLIVSVVIAAVLALVTFGFRLKTKTWSHPAVVFSGFWFLMTALPILVAPQISLSPYAFSYILLAVVAFGLPALVVDWDEPVRVAAARLVGAPNKNMFTSRELLIVFFALQIAPIIFILINLELQGFHLSSLSDPLKLNCEYLSARYNGHVSKNLAMSSGTLANYVGAPIGGMILANRKDYRLSSLILLMSFVPGALNMIAYADKGTIFLTAAYFYGGVIVGRVASGNLSLITSRSVLGAVAAAVFLIPLVSLAMINRNVGACDSSNRSSQVMSAVTNVVTSIEPTLPSTPKEPEKTEIKTIDANPVSQAPSHFIFYMRSYSVGAQFAFSDWFDNHIFGHSSQPYSNPTTSTLGRYTFMFLARQIDRPWAATIPDGYFDEYFEQKDVLRTNIYTLWRGLIDDFTTPGSIIFMLAIGFIMNFSYRAMLLRDVSPISQSAYVTFAGFTYCSSLISIFTWNSPAAAFFVLAAILLVIHLKEKQDTKNDGTRHHLLRSSGSPADVRDFLPGRAD